MNRKDYQGLDLGLFPLNDQGLPLARPWIEQEKKIHISAGKFEFAKQDPDWTPLIPIFRDWWESPFDPSRDLVGEQAVFGGWEYLGKAFYISHNPHAHAVFGNERYTLKNDQSSEYVDSVKPKTKGDWITACSWPGIPLILTPYGVRQILGITEGAGE